MKFPELALELKEIGNAATSIKSIVIEFENRNCVECSGEFLIYSL